MPGPRSNQSLSTHFTFPAQVEAKVVLGLKLDFLARGRKPSCRTRRTPHRGTGGGSARKGVLVPRSAALGKV